MRKVPLRCTPHMVTYHLESKTYCLVTSSSEPSNEYYRFNGEDKEHSVEERDERFPLPMQDKFSVMLFSPVSWEVRRWKSVLIVNLYTYDQLHQYFV